MAKALCHLSPMQACTATGLCRGRPGRRSARAHDAKRSRQEPAPWGRRGACLVGPGAKHVVVCVALQPAGVGWVGVGVGSGWGWGGVGEGLWGLGCGGDWGGG